MQSHFSLILILLVLVWVATVVIRALRQKRSSREQIEPQLNLDDINDFGDDGIIAVRKRERFAAVARPQEEVATIKPHNHGLHQEQERASPNIKRPINDSRKVGGASSQLTNLIVLYIMAKGNKQFAGYELLQSLLTAGMRFGEMNIFHRYHGPNGNGSVLFSLAAATEPGTFDIHNMGAFVGCGLTIFLQKSDNATIDLERFELMLKTAQQLSEDLDGNLLDEKRELLTHESITNKKNDLARTANPSASYV